MSQAHPPLSAHTSKRGAPNKMGRNPFDSRTLKVGNKNEAAGGAPSHPSPAHESEVPHPLKPNPLSPGQILQGLYWLCEGALCEVSVKFLKATRVRRFVGLIESQKKMKSTKEA